MGPGTILQKKLTGIVAAKQRRKRSTGIETPMDEAIDSISSSMEMEQTRKPNENENSGERGAVDWVPLVIDWAIPAYLAAVDWVTKTWMTID